MSKNLDSIFYIVISVIIIFASILRKKRTTSGKSRESSLSNNLFDIITGQTSNNIINDIEPIAEPIVIEPVIDSSTQKIEQEIKNNPSLKKSITPNKKIDDYNLPSINNDNDFKFDIEKAIIYSEILNNKYC